MICCTTAIFILLGSTQDAFEMLERGKACFQVLKSYEYLNMFKLTEASIHSIKKNFGKAQEILEETSLYYKESHNNEGLAESLLLQGLICEDVDNSLAMITQACKLFTDNKAELGRARAQLAIAEIKVKQKTEDSDNLSILNSSISIFEKFEQFF